MTTKRRTYTDEFKREEVRLWENTDKTAAAIESDKYHVTHYHHLSLTSPLLPILLNLSKKTAVTRG